MVAAQDRPPKTKPKISVEQRNRLALENDRLALKIAHRCAKQCPEPLEDLMQIARMGLLRACEKFDPTQGVAFSSLAVPFIEGEIQHFLRDKWGLVKIPRRLFEVSAKVKKIQRNLKAKGREVPASRIAQALGIPEKKWQWISDAVARKPVSSLDELHDRADEEEMTPHDKERLREWVLRELARLPKLQRECLVCRFFGGMDDEQIARKHRIPVGDVETVVDRAFVKLQRRLEGVQWDC